MSRIISKKNKIISRKFKKATNKVKIFYFEQGFWLYYRISKMEKEIELKDKELSNLKNELVYLKGQVLNKNRKIVFIINIPLVVI